MWLGTARREGQTMEAHLCWTMQGAWEIGLDAAGEEGEVRDGGLARTGTWATTLGFCPRRGSRASTAQHRSAGAGKRRVGARSAGSRG